MSYDIVKRISIRNKSITCASNNLVPRQFETTRFVDSDSLSDEDFIKRCLIDFLDGNFKASGNSCSKFVFAINKFINDYPEDNNRLKDIRWNNYDYVTKTLKHSKEELDEARIELENILYKLYQEADNTPKGSFGLKYLNINGMWAGKVTKTKIRLVHSEDAKVFNSYCECYNYFYSDKIGDARERFEVAALSQ